jgi:uncharacterized protein involved in outer membrane biogenesis
VRRFSIRPRLRSLLIATLGLAGLAGGIELLARGIALDMLGNRIEADLEDALGLKVSMSQLRLSLLPRPTLQASGVKIASPKGRSTPHLLEVEELRIGLAPWPLDGNTVKVVALDLRGTRLYLESDPETGHGISLDVGELAADTRDHDVWLNLRHLGAQDLRVFRRRGPNGPVRSLIVDSLRIDADGLDEPIFFASDGLFERADFELDGRGGSLQQLLEAASPYPIHIVGRLFEAELELEGSIADPLALAGVDLAISAELPDLVLAGRPLPGLGPIAFHARLSDLDGSMGLEQFDVTTRRREPLDIDVDGSVDDLLGLSEVKIAARVDAKRLDFLDGLVDARIPAVDSATVDLKLSDADGSLGLDGSARVSTPEGRIVVNASGSYGDLTRLGEIGVDVEARALHLDVLRDLVEGLPPLPELGPVRASGRLRDLDGRLALDDLELQLGRRDDVWLTAAGDLSDVLNPDGMEFDVTFGARSTQRLGAVIGRELPALGAIEGGARVTDRDGSFGIEDFHARIHGHEAIEMRLSGGLDDVLEWNEIEAAIDLRARDLGVLGALVGLELPARGPVEFQGKVRGSDESVAGEAISLRIGETRLHGSFAGSFAAGARPLLRASVESPHVHLQDLGVVPEPNRGGSSPDSRPGRGALPFEQLRAFDLGLSVHADRVTGYEGLDLRDVNAELQLDDGHLRVVDVGAIYERGKVRGELRVDSRTPTPEVSLNLDVTGVDIGRLMSQFEEQTEFSGLVDLSIELESSGRTADELRAALAGRVNATLREGTAASALGRRFTVDLIRTIFPEMTPRPVPMIGCAIVDFEIEDGMATVETLLLREGEITVTGVGEVDLVEGVYDLRLTPSTTNPALLSVTPQVEVGGPLDAPEFRAIRRTLATSLIAGLGENARRAGMLLVRPFGSRKATVERAEAACERIGGEPTAEESAESLSLPATAPPEIATVLGR